MDSIIKILAIACIPLGLWLCMYLLALDETNIIGRFTEWWKWFIHN